MIEVLQARLKELARYAKEVKGLLNVEVKMEITSNDSICGSVYYRLDTYGTTKAEYFFEGSVEANIEAIFEHFKAVETLEMRERAEYLKKVGAALEYGKKVGIAEEFLNPLAVEMKRLSENVITYQPLNNYVVQSANHDRMTLDDDIPF